MFLFILVYILASEVASQHTMLTQCPNVLAKAVKHDTRDNYLSLLQMFFGGIFYRSDSYLCFMLIESIRPMRVEKQ